MIDFDSLVSFPLETASCPDGQGIYAIVCLANNKLYVGSAAVSFKKRIALHLWRLNTDQHHCSHLQNAFNKYGVENFVLCVLQDLPTNEGESKDEYKPRILEAEQYWLDLFDIKMKFNDAIKAGCSLGVKHDAEFSRKISVRVKKAFLDPVYKAKFIDRMSKANSSPKIRARRSEIMKERANRPEVKAKQSEYSKKSWAENRDRIMVALLEAIRDPEYRENMRQHMLERWSNPEYKERVTKAMREAANTPENKARLSKQSKKNWENPEYRELIRQKQLESWQDPEYRENMARKRRESWQDPSFREKQLKRMEENRRNPEIEKRRKENVAKALQTDECRAKISVISKKQNASRSKPVILISPERIMYVTDSHNGFGEQFGLSRASLQLLTNGKQKSPYQGWTGYRLESWNQVPSEAIRVLWGDHPELPEQIMSHCKSTEQNFVQLGLWGDH